MHLKCFLSNVTIVTIPDDRPQHPRTAWQTILFYYEKLRLSKELHVSDNRRLLGAPDTRTPIRERKVTGIPFMKAGASSLQIRKDAERYPFSFRLKLPQ